MTTIQPDNLAFYWTVPQQFGQVSQGIAPFFILWIGITGGQIAIARELVIEAVTRIIEQNRISVGFTPGFEIPNQRLFKLPQGNLGFLARLHAIIGFIFNPWQALNPKGKGARL